MVDKQFPIGKFTYAGPLSEHDRLHAIELISTLGSRLIELLSGYSDHLMDTPYRPGGWTARQVIHHLFDSHAHAYIRIKYALTEENPSVKAYHQDQWANLADSKMPVHVSAAAIGGLQARLGFLLASLNPEEFERTLVHSERGQITIDYLTALYAWHGEHHLEHIRLSLHD
jgi:hypothetical protein